MTFRKGPQCPSSQDLSDFQNEKTGAKNAKTIDNHVRVCEFCTVELDFYRRFPQNADALAVEAPADIPRPLFELAEALLSKKYLDFLSLNKIFHETERLKV